MAIKDILKEFKDFAVKGNVIDMAIGIIIGGAFSPIVNSLVKDIINKLNGMEFKRNQATFSIRLSSLPLFRRNFPIVNKFRY